MSMHTMISRVYFARQEQRDQLKASLQTGGGNGQSSDGEKIVQNSKMRRT